MSLFLYLSGKKKYQIMNNRKYWYTCLTSNPVWIVVHTINHSLPVLGLIIYSLNIAACCLKEYLLPFIISKIADLSTGLILTEIDRYEMDLVISVLGKWYGVCVVMKNLYFPTMLCIGNMEDSLSRSRDYALDYKLLLTNATNVFLIEGVSRKIASCFLFKHYWIIY